MRWIFLSGWETLVAFGRTNCMQFGRLIAISNQQIVGTSVHRSGNSGWLLEVRSSLWVKFYQYRTFNGVSQAHRNLDAQWLRDALDHEFCNANFTHRGYWEFFFHTN